MLSLHIAECGHVWSFQIVSGDTEIDCGRNDYDINGNYVGESDCEDDEFGEVNIGDMEE